jgi:hypothetical protein
VLVLSGIVCVSTQFVQARRVIGRFASDERNPFAYVPTRNDIETLEAWLLELRRMNGGISLEPMAVIGSDYWPLPWYLRDFGKIGYWREVPDGLSNMPVVFAMPEVEPAVMRALADSHTQLPRGLRAGVPVVMFLRNDIRELWNQQKSR